MLVVSLCEGDKQPQISSQAGGKTAADVSVSV